MFKKIVGLALTGSLALSITVPINTYANDIKNHQMVNELTYWANQDVILPDSKGNFYPNRDVTRGEFASYIARAFDLPQSSKYTFSDMKEGNQLTREVQAAAGANILSGYSDGTFKPHQKITRQQMAGMLYKALRYLDVPLTQSKLTFKDNYKIDASFTNAVATNVDYNIIRGDNTANGVYFKPKDSATIAHAAAFLFRMNSVVNDHTPEEDVEEEPIKEEAVDSTSYYIGQVVKGVVARESKKYTTYEQALNAYEASNGANLILQGDKIVKMTSGIAYAADTTANTTSVYVNRNFTNQITYITQGRELKYIGSNGDYAIVQVGDIVGYARLSEVELVPTSLIEGRDEYFVTDGMLNHRIFNHVTGKSEGYYTVGPAPDFLTSGASYYSFDGVHFYNSSNKLIGTYFPYFQFASVRQPSNYTAEELDEIIVKELKARENTGSSIYKNASTQSKLLGLGSFIKEMEEKHHVNALFILATAMHESNFGMSTKAQTINNLFGIRVIDSDEENTGDKYNTQKNSVEAFINEYINKNYVPQTGKYPFGASPGNKNTGINVYYASDPHWGAKIAGHMYRIDLKYGKKDYGKGKLGMVLTEGGYVNTRTQPTTNSAIAFTYKVKSNGESDMFGFPVVIVDETKASNGYVWYKVHSDNPSQEFVWIRSDLVKVLPGY